MVISLPPGLLPLQHGQVSRRHGLQVPALVVFLDLLHLTENVCPDSGNSRENFDNLREHHQRVANLEVVVTLQAREERLRDAKVPLVHELDELLVRNLLRRRIREFHVEAAHRSALFFVGGFIALPHRQLGEGLVEELT